MKISNITYDKIFLYNNLGTCSPVFTGRYRLLSLKDIFIRNEDKGLDSITDIKAGDFGTECKGSKPLLSFLSQFSTKNEFNSVKKIGLSTNKNGFAYSFLKAKSNKPISTSNVHDCSVIYLYNKNTQTHFLYHYHPETSNEEFEYMIKHFMKEGYTHASIVPGENCWSDIHACYLPIIFKTIKKNNRNANVMVYHYMSEMPEIVGYKGKMFQIPLEDKSIEGQASFNILNVHKGNTLTKLHYSDDLAELFNLRILFDSLNFNREIKDIMLSLLKERELEIRKLEKFSSIDELEQYLATKSDDYKNGLQEYNHNSYRTVIREQKEKLLNLSEKIL